MSEERKRQAEAAGRQDMKRFWGDVLQESIAAAIADIRVHVVEKGWYGEPLYDYARDSSAEFYGRADLQKAERDREQEHAKAREALER